MDSVSPPQLGKWTRFALFAFLTGKTDIEIGREVGVHPESIRRYRRPLGAHRQREPHSDIKVTIAKWSGGAVPIDSWNDALDGMLVFAGAVQTDREGAA